MNRLLKTFALTAPLLSAALLSSGSADACGGCFAPPSTNTVVSGHRMALSISNKQTVLWDQIQYQGNPEEFSWVLPIKPGARIEVASDAWFETLESATVTTVQAPPLNCGNSGQTFGCGSQTSFAASEDSGGTGGPDGVTVVHQETIGPYETVTLSSKDANALSVWLDDHNYAVPDDVQPVISAYVKEGFDFIALRLTPGNGVNLMQPVRVIMDGASPVLPLRMVAAGTGAFTSIILYVIGEGRWTTAGFAEGSVAFDKLVWDGDTNQSNYSQLRDAALATNGGNTFLATYAQRDVFFNYQFNDETGFGTGGIGYTYYNQLNDEEGSNWEMVSECQQKADSAKNSGGVVVDPCDHATMECGSVASGEIDARDFTCGELTDLSVAMVGMHPSDVWITRLEANLPRLALGADLTLEASADQKSVENFHIADKAENYECPSSPVTGPAKNGKGTPSGNGTAVILAGLGAVAALLAARRGRFLRA